MAAEKKGKKLRRCTAQSKAYYKLQFGTTDSNRKKRLIRHIRSNPFDTAARERFEQDMGEAKGIGLNTHGRHKLERANATHRYS